MREDEIRQLIRILEEHEGIGEIEVAFSRFGARKVRVARRAQSAGEVVHVQAGPPARPAAAEPAYEGAAESSGYHAIKAPMVGTFYRAPSPDSDPYVSEGARVSPGTILCIIEAMKLMNEIECDVAGTVREILVENGQAIEFGQPLFLIDRE